MSLPFSEDQNVDHPVSLYAATKKANELIAHSYSHLYRLPDDGLRFLHDLRAVGPSDMAPMLFTKAILRRPPDPRVQQREDAPRFHVCRRHRRRHRAGAGPAARGRRRRRARTGSTTSAITRPSSWKRSSPHSSGCSGGPRSGTMRRCNPATLPATYARSTGSPRLTGFAPKTPLADGLARFVAWYREYYST
jgi:UDP-glucuronate 4-epimerase